MRISDWSSDVCSSDLLRAEIWSWSRARGLFAGVALDGAGLSIDDEANQAVYGAGTTPRMIFEDRAANAPSTAIVNFRDELEEATAAARAARGTGTASPAVATQPATTRPGQPTTTGTEPTPADPQPPHTQPRQALG